VHTYIHYICVCIFISPFLYICIYNTYTRIYSIINYGMIGGEGNINTFANHYVIVYDYGVGKSRCSEFGVQAWIRSVAETLLRKIRRKRLALELRLHQIWCKRFALQVRLRLIWLKRIIFTLSR
jgi:hypothetical protein